MIKLYENLKLLNSFFYTVHVFILSFLCAVVSACFCMHVYKHTFTHSFMHHIVYMLSEQITRALTYDISMCSIVRTSWSSLITKAVKVSKRKNIWPSFCFPVQGENETGLHWYFTTTCQWELFMSERLPLHIHYLS